MNDDDDDDDDEEEEERDPDQTNPGLKKLADTTNKDFLHMNCFLHLPCSCCRALSLSCFFNLLLQCRYFLWQERLSIYFFN